MNQIKDGFRFGLKKGFKIQNLKIAGNSKTRDKSIIENFQD